MSESDAVPLSELSHAERKRLGLPELEGALEVERPEERPIRIPKSIRRKDAAEWMQSLFNSGD